MAKTPDNALDQFPVAVNLVIKLLIASLLQTLRQVHLRFKKPWGNSQSLFPESICLFPARGSCTNHRQITKKLGCFYFFGYQGSIFCFSKCQVPGRLCVNSLLPPDILLTGNDAFGFNRFLKVILDFSLLLLIAVNLHQTGKTH
jgi:hypothetical protein